MRIILSNNHGIHAAGIQQLVLALRQLVTVQIVSPDRDCSGASNLLTLDVTLRTQTKLNGDIAILSGTPTDCIYLAVNALIHTGQDIVVSSINANPNLGDDTIYSGTVAATIDGRHLGYSPLAVSFDDSRYFSNAAAVTCCLLCALTYAPLRTGKILNINVPDLPLSSINGYKATICGRRHPASEVIRQTAPRGHEMLRIGSPAGSIDEGPSTYFEAVSQSYVSLMPLQVDLTANAALPVLSDWLGDTEGLTPW